MNKDEERLMQLLESVEKEEERRVRELTRDQLAIRRQLFNDNDADNLIIHDEENEDDNVEQFLDNTDSEYDEVDDDRNTFQEDIPVTEEQLYNEPQVGTLYFTK